MQGNPSMLESDPYDRHRWSESLATGPTKSCYIQPGPRYREVDTNQSLYISMEKEDCGIIY